MQTHFPTVLLAQAAEYRTRAATAESTLLSWILQAVAKDFERQARMIDPGVEAEITTDPVPPRPARIDKRV